MEEQAIVFEDEIEGAGPIEIDGVLLSPLEDFIPKDASACKPVTITFTTSMSEHIYTKVANSVNRALYGLEMVIPRFMVEREYVVACENMIEEELEKLAAEAKEDRNYLMQIVKDEGRELASVVHKKTLTMMSFSGGYGRWHEIMCMVNEVLQLTDTLTLEARIKPSKRSDTFNKWRHMSHAAMRKFKVQAQHGFTKMANKIEEMRTAPDRDRSNDRNRLTLAKREAAQHRKERKREERALAERGGPTDNAQARRPGKQSTQRKNAQQHAGQQKPSQGKKKQGRTEGRGKVTTQGNGQQGGAPKQQGKQNGQPVRAGNAQVNGQHNGLKQGPVPTSAQTVGGVEKPKLVPVPDLRETVKQAILAG